MTYIIYAFSGFITYLMNDWKKCLIQYIIADWIRSLKIA